MDIPTIFLALKDKDTPILAKIFGSITVVYVLSPIDLVPDFIPTDIIERNRWEAEGLWERGRPNKWYYAIPIVLFWIVVIVLILKMVL